MWHKSQWFKNIVLQGVWESDLSYTLQGVVISEKHQEITLTVKSLTVLIDCCADAVLIVACCAIPVAPSSHCFHLTLTALFNQWWVITKFISQASGLETY